MSKYPNKFSTSPLRFDPELKSLETHGIQNLHHFSLRSLYEIPRYAFDGFTRAGKRYLKKLVRQYNPLKSFLAQAAPVSERDALVREIYFRIESSLCDKRLDWAIGNEARRRADEVGFGLDASAFNVGKIILREAISEMPMTEADL